MPVCSVNFFTLAMYASMSPCTKRLQRSTRSFAPFSGLNLSVGVCAAADARPQRAAGAERCGRGDAGRAFQELAAIERSSSGVSSGIGVEMKNGRARQAASRWPVPASNRCARSTSGCRWIVLSGAKS